MKLPHEDTVDAARWKKIHFSSWTGGHGSPSVPGREASQTPCVHLTRPGSNLCLSGFTTPKEAQEYRDTHGLPAWRVTDLRDDRPSLTDSDLYMQRRARIDEIFEGWDFETHIVADQNGWEYDGVDRFSRIVFFEVDAPDTLALHFAVDFHPGSSNEVHVEFDRDRLPEASSDRVEEVMEP